VADISIDTY